MDKYINTWDNDEYIPTGQNRSNTDDTYGHGFQFRKEFIQDNHSANLMCCQYLLFDTKEIKRLRRATEMMARNRELGPRHPYHLLNHNSSDVV